MGFNLKQLRFGRWAALLTVCLAARAVAGTSEGAGDFVAEVWDTDSGLPQNTVTSLAQTPDGYLWIGTLHGGTGPFRWQSFYQFSPCEHPRPQVH